MSQFSPELCKLESSNMIYVCRMSACIMGLRLRVMTLIFLFFVHFSFFPYITCKHIKFMSEFSQELFQAKILKLVIHMGNKLLYCGIENWTPCSYSSLYSAIFCLLRLKLRHSFLRLRVMALIFLFIGFDETSTYYSPALKKVGLYWIWSVRNSVIT